MNETLELTNEAPSSSKRRKQNDNQVRRPMNAFMVYAQVARKKVAGKYPNLSYRKLSKTLGELWRMLDDEERRPFVEEAERLRREHKRAHPTYKFKPQRRRKKVEKQCEAGSSVYGGLMNSSESGSLLQGRIYANHEDYGTASDLLPSSYLSSHDSANSVSSTWPFVPNNSSGHYFDVNSNIVGATRGFPNPSTLTANSSVNFPNQRPYFDSVGLSEQLGRQSSCPKFDPVEQKMSGEYRLGGVSSTQTNSVVSLVAPEQSSVFNTAKFLDNTSPSSSVSFSESYPHMPSMDNLPYVSDSFSLSNRGLPTFSRSTPANVISSTNLIPQVSTSMNNPYTRNLFTELSTRSLQTRNEPILSFMEHMWYFDDFIVYNKLHFTDFPPWLWLYNLVETTNKQSKYVYWFGLANVLYSWLLIYTEGVDDFTLL